MSDIYSSEYGEKYSENSFWDKVKKYAKVAGESVLSPALKMYYALLDSDTPMLAKTTIVGGLGYFISPIDAIPDITPVVGYSDDLGVLLSALAVVSTSIKDEHVQKAKEILKRWFE